MNRSHSVRAFLSLAALLLLIGAGCLQLPDGVSDSASVRPAESAADVPADDPTPVPPEEPEAPAAPATNGGTDAGVNGDSADAINATPVFVTIGAGGTFFPAVVTIKEGMKVTWKNEGDLPVWIGSDPHPTHTGYAAFDQKTGMRKGESWTFVFDEKGSWGYHNHLNSRMKGTVIVE